MKFEWDPQKAESNRRKYDVSFEEAITVFKDTLAFIFDDEKHSQSGPQKIIIHVEYGDEKAVFSIADGKLLAGKFPKNKTRLVQAWIEIRREELNADWKLAVKGEEVFKIDPLK